MVYTTRLAGGRGGRNALETLLREKNIVQKHSHPNHPTTCGKVERVQQTFKNWLRAQAPQPATVSDLQVLLEAFVAIYNTRRPHRSLPHRATPATVYTPDPKRLPAATAPAIPTTASAPTESTPTARSRRESTGDFTTSASAEPTPEPPS